MPATRMDQSPVTVSGARLPNDTMRRLDSSSVSTLGPSNSRPGKPLAPEAVRRPQHGLAHHRRCRRDLAPPLEHDLHVGAAVRRERLERRGEPVRRHLSRTRHP